MGDIFRYTLRLLKSRAARSLLTVLQVALGIWAISLLISANINIKDQIDQATAAYGQDLVVITAARPEQRDDGSIRYRNVGSFGLEDLVNLQESGAIAQAYIAEPLGLTMNIAVDNQNYRLQGLLGVTEHFPGASGLEIVHGDFFTSMDVQQGSSVILVSESVARQLFPGESAVGRTVELGSGFATMGVSNVARRGAATTSQEYEIIGVFKDIDDLQSTYVGITHGIIPLGSQTPPVAIPSPTQESAQVSESTQTSAAEGSNQGSQQGSRALAEEGATSDDPHTPGGARGAALPEGASEMIQRFLPTGQAVTGLYPTVTIQAMPGQAHTAANEARVLLAAAAGENELMVEYVKDREGQLFDTVNQTVYFLLAFGFIAMVISSVGILSVMMISVVERTRAIGLHRALGASRNWIRMQFLMESVLLSLVGAVVGIALAVLSSHYVLENLLYRAFWEELAPTASTGIHPTAILASVLGAIVIGMIFGYFPAKEGSDLAPVEALRQS